MHKFYYHNQWNFNTKTPKHFSYYVSDYLGLGYLIILKIDWYRCNRPEYTPGRSIPGYIMA